jgi:hypothetical protein
MASVWWVELAYARHGLNSRQIPIIVSKAHRIPNRNDGYHCLSTEVSIRIDAIAD